VPLATPGRLDATFFQVAPSFADANQVPQRTIFMEEPTAEEFKKLQDEMRQIFVAGK